jgi:transposase
MTARFEGPSDEAWRIIEQSANFTLSLQRGIPRTDLRKIWSSIFYILISGARCPVGEQFAAKPTAHRWLLRWQKEGVFDRVLNGLLQDAIRRGLVDLSHLAVDGTFFPGPGGGKQVGYGYKGKGVLIHLLVDRQGNPLAASSTSSGGDERKEAVKLLDKIPLRLWGLRTQKLSILEADKGDDSNHLRQPLLNRHILPLTPYKKNRKGKVSLKEICSRFFVIKRRLGSRKNNRLD